MRGRIPCLNELRKKSQATLILGKRVSKSKSSSHWLIAFFTGQNLKHVFITYSFLELLIFFWPTLVYIYCLDWILFFTTLKKYYMWIQTSKEINHEIKTNIFTCSWHWCWNIVFLNVKSKFLRVIFNILSFMNIFSEAVVRRCSSTQVLLKILQYSELKTDFNTDVFLWRLQSFYEQLFYRTPPVAASAFFQN